MSNSQSSSSTEELYKNILIAKETRVIKLKENTRYLFIINPQWTNISEFNKLLQDNNIEAVIMASSNSQNVKVEEL